MSMFTLASAQNFQSVHFYRANKFGFRKSYSYQLFFNLAGYSYWMVFLNGCGSNWCFFFYIDWFFLLTGYSYWLDISINWIFWLAGYSYWLDIPTGWIFLLAGYSNWMDILNRWGLHLLLILLCSCPILILALQHYFYESWSNVDKPLLLGLEVLWNNCVCRRSDMYLHKIDR